MMPASTRIGLSRESAEARARSHPQAGVGMCRPPNGGDLLRELPHTGKTIDEPQALRCILGFGCHAGKLIQAVQDLPEPLILLL